MTRVSRERTPLSVTPLALPVSTPSEGAPSGRRSPSWWPSGRRSPSWWPSRMSGGRPRRSSLCPGPLSAVRTSVQPTNWSGGRRCPGARCPRDRCDRGVRTDSRPVSAAAAAKLSAARWIRNPSVRRGRPRRAHQVRRVAVVGERLARRCPNRAWRGRDGPTLAVGRSHQCRGQRWAAVATAAWYAHRLRRRACRLATKGELTRRQRAGGARKEQVLTKLPGRWVLGGLSACCRPSGWTGRW